jgi:hypothetical protein
MGALSILGILWLAFNAAVVAIAVVRAVRTKRQIRERSIDRLMAAHFASVAKTKYETRPLSQMRVASPSLASDGTAFFPRRFAAG